MNRAQREAIQRCESDYCAATDRALDFMEQTRKANAAGAVIPPEVATEAVKALEESQRAAEVLVRARRELWESQ